MSDTRILVVDDESGIRDLLSFELGSHGYQVFTAKDGFEAVEQVKKQKFDLVISDMKMPGKDGIATLDEIKKIDPALEVVMATGFGTIETAVEALKKGAYDFVQKPFHIDELLAIIEKALKKKQLETLVALYESSKAVFSTVKLDELLSVVMDLIQKVLNADEGSLMLMDGQKKLHIAASRGIDESIARTIHLNIGDRIAGRVAEERKPLLLINGLKDYPAFAGIESNGRIGSSIVIPLVCGQEILGVLNLSRHTGRENFATSDLYKASFFASQVAQALQNAKLYGELETKVDELKKAYKMLEDTKDQLVQSEKLVAVGRLVAGVAHEINNPLTSIIGYSDLIVNHSKVDGEFKEMLGVVFDEAQRCRKIVQDLLVFARHKEPSFQSVNLDGLIDQAFEALSLEIKKGGVWVDKKCEVTSTVDADPYQLKQVFINIVSNAIHALQEINDRPRQITFSAVTKDKDTVRIAIADNGPGIAEKHLSKIFDPFFSTKEVGKGTGLGLSLTYGLVKDHGGRIWAESKEGKGASFIIELPFKNARAKTATAMTTPTDTGAGAGTKTQGRRILVIEDEPAIRQFLTKALSAHGFTIESVADGPTAFSALEKTDYDVVLCDHRLPKMSGLTLFNKVRYMMPHKAERFVFVTGSTADHNLENFFQENHLMRLFKPFTADELLAVVQKKLKEMGS